MKIATGLAGAMSGSLGGITASHNRGGAYFRNRVIPTNPSTTRQEVVRTAFSAAVQAWTQTLTNEQRAGWTQYANNTPTTDSLGQPLVLTGQQAFIRQYVVFNQINLAPVLNAPTTYNSGSPIDLLVDELTYDGGGPAFIIGGSISPATDATGTGVLYLGRPVNESRVFYKGPYQLMAIQSVGAPPQTTIEFTSEDPTSPQWNPSYVPEVGQFVPLRARIIYSDGRLSTAITKIVPVVAAV